MLNCSKRRLSESAFAFIFGSLNAVRHGSICRMRPQAFAHIIHDCMNKLIIFIAACILLGCSATRFRAKWASEKSPETYSARFVTSKGDFEVTVSRNLSPRAADRMYQLLRHHVFDNALFYRVAPNFVAQFGSTDTVVTNQWNKYKVPDEPVMKSNTRGTLSFARAGRESRGTQLYINLRDNPKLDTIRYNGVTGFPVFGVVTKGMDVVDSLFSGYGDSIFKDFDSLSPNRRLFLKKYPRLDSIRSATLLKKER